MTVQASRICRAADGKWHAYDCILHHSRPMMVAEAIERARMGKTVFVLRENTGTVLGAVTDGG